jgi:sugar lactone lactonase YvrE
MRLIGSVILSIALSGCGAVAYAPPDAPGALSAQAVPIGLVSNLAGSGLKGYRDDTVDIAQFDWPFGVVQSSGSYLVADYNNNAIRLITATGVTTLAGGQRGSKDGVGKAAEFDVPQGIALDSEGNVLVTEGACRLRRVTSTGVVSTLSSGGTCFGHVALDKQRRQLYATSDTRVWRLNGDGVATLLVGSPTAGYKNGHGADAQFRGLIGVVCDSSGNLFVSDSVDNRIRRITPDGDVTTVAGSGVGGFSDGVGEGASFNEPLGLGIDNQDNVYVADAGNYRVRRITPDGRTTTLAGSGFIGGLTGEGPFASFNTPTDVTVDNAGDVFVADNGNNQIRKISASGTGVLNVKWHAPSANPAVSGYDVVARALSQPDRACSTQDTTCTLWGLASGIPYTITVTAKNAVGAGASATIIATAN